MKSWRFVPTSRACRRRSSVLLFCEDIPATGYFVPSDKVPEAIIEHIATMINRRVDREELHRYDQSKVRFNHLMAVRRFLDVKPFSTQGKTLLRTTLSEAALTKEDVADIVNVGIEIWFVTGMNCRRLTPWYGSACRACRHQSSAVRASAARSG